MELIRRNSDYALRSLTYMAGFPSGKKLTVKLIAKKQDVPVAFLRKIFQKLSLNRIITSCRGPGGGFYLLKEPQQISLKEILESVQGRITLSDCLWESNLCNRSRTCKIKPGLSIIQKKLKNLFDGYTLSDFLSNEKNYP